VLAPGFHQSTGMNWQYAYTSHILPSIFTVMLLMAVAVYAWRRRNLPGASWFVIYCLLALPILAFHVIEYLAVDFETKIFWFNVEYLWWLPGTTAMTCFVLEYAWPRRWVTRRTAALLSLAPLLCLAFLFANGSHDLLFRGYEFNGDVDPLYGSAGWAFMAYNWGLRVASTVALVWLFVRSPQHRWPAILIVSAEIVVGGLLVLDPAIHESTFFYVPWKTIPVVACAIALFGFHIFDPIPLARQTVIAQLQAGMLVLDLKGRVVSVNPAAECSLNGSAKQVEGKLVKDLLPAYPGNQLADSGGTEIELGDADGTGLRQYILTSSLLRDFRHLEVGRLLLLRDVTEQKRAQAQVLDRLTRLQEASSHLISTLDLDQTMGEIARQSAWLLSCPSAGMVRLARNNDQFELVASFGLSEDQRRTLSDDLPDWAFLNDLATQPRSIIIQDTMPDRRLPDSIRERLGLSAILITPIWTSEKPDDFIVVIDTNATRRWSEADIEQIESLSSRAAVALVSANLHHQHKLAAALEERQRIAANMHDGLAQTLGLLGLKVDQANESIARGDGPQAQQILEQMSDVVGRASEEVRLSISSLQANVQPRKSVQDMLAGLVEQFEAGHGEVAWSLTSHMTEPLFLPADQREQLVPVVREALSNACRHARAAQIRVTLERDDNRMLVLVEDDGQGFSGDLALEGQAGHFGLRVMRARAARMGGDLQVDSVQGGGTRVSLCWPLDPDRRRAFSPPAEAAIPSATATISEVRG
jgi:signal transduction histidine kinase